MIKAIIIRFDGFNIRELLSINENTLDEAIRMIDEMAWARKYLIADSVDLILVYLKITGMKLIRLSSNPSQQVNHEFAEIAINVPKIREIKKRA